MKRTLICLLAALCFAAYQPVPVYAGFFLFNIINDVFNGGSKNKQKEKEQQPDINTTLKHGMQNSQVVILQQQLIKASYLKGKADGIFGYQTQQALKAFQRDSGLAVDGVAGPQGGSDGLGHGGDGAGMGIKGAEIVGDGREGFGGAAGEGGATGGHDGG